MPSSSARFRFLGCTVRHSKSTPFIFGAYDFFFFLNCYYIGKLHTPGGYWTQELTLHPVFLQRE